MGSLKKKIPLVLFVIVSMGAYLGFKYSSKKIGSVDNKTNVSREISQASKGRLPTNVVVNRVKVQDFYEQFNAIGSGRAIAEVELTPWSAGVLNELFVSAGDKVKAGDVIAKLDSKKEEIAAARAKVQRDNNALTLSRILRLRTTNTATEVQEISARLELDNADLILRDADLALERRTIRAPIDGVVGILPVDKGNAVNLNTVIGRIENKERILIDLWVPERYASRIHKGDEVKVTVIAQPDKTFVGHIYALNNTIDDASRTLHVQVEIPNEDYTLMSGMSFSVSFQFPAGSFPVVDPLAVQWSSRGALVWRVKDGKVEYVPVSILQRRADHVFVKAPLESGDQIVVQGVQMLYPGSSVVIVDDIDQEHVSSVNGWDEQ